MEKNTQLFETLLAGSENKIKQKEAPAAQEQPAATEDATADTAAAAAGQRVQTLLATKDTTSRAFEEAVILVRKLLRQPIISYMYLMLILLL